MSKSYGDYWDMAAMIDVLLPIAYLVNHAANNKNHMIVPSLDFDFFKIGDLYSPKMPGNYSTVIRFTNALKPTTRFRLD